MDAIKIEGELNKLHNTTEVDNQYEEMYKVTPYRLSYSMSHSEVGIIVIMLTLIFVTLILICIASNLKSTFKGKMSNLGVVVMSVNGEKKVGFQNFNTLFQAPVDLRTTSFMNVAMPDPRNNQQIHDWNKANCQLQLDNVSTYR